MPTPPLVHASLVRPFVEYLSEHGCPAGSYLLRSRLPELLLEPADFFVSEYHVYRMVGEAARREGLHNLGSRVGGRFSIRELGGLEDRIASRQTLYAGLQLLCREFTGPLISHQGFWLSREGERILFCRRPPAGMDRGSDQIEQYAVEFMVGIVRMFAGPRWLPAEIWLRAAESAGTFERSELRSADILPGRPHTAISLPEPWLSAQRPSRLSGPSETSKGSFADFVRELLRPYMGEASLDLRLAASLSRVSERTIKRQLAVEGLGFRDIVQQLRFSRAQMLLDDTDASIIEISNELSYDSPSNFSRAFRRWAATSPSHYRRLRTRPN